jgi:hypothetical protein
VSRPLKIIVILASASAIILVLVALVLLLSQDAESYRSRVQEAGTAALGMDVEIGGPLRFRLQPGLLVTLADVHVHNRGRNVGSASVISLGIDLLSLFAGNVRIRSIALHDVSLFIEKDLDGSLNVGTGKDVAGAAADLPLTRVTLVGGTLHYADELSGNTLHARDCDLTFNGLRRPGDSGANPMGRVSFAAQLACSEIQLEGHTMTNLQITASAKEGVILLEPVSMEIFDGKGSARVRADYSAGVPRYDVGYSLPNFHIEAFFASLAPKKVAEGSMTFTADLSMQGTTLLEFRQTMYGRLSLRGHDLLLFGNDIDDTYSRYESSQTFNLADLGAFFFAGPLGIVVTKGYEFTSILDGSEGSSTIRTLVSDWTVEAGVAEAQDVAMATNENRIALKGRVDLVNEEFVGLSMALIDSNGCVKVEQKIRGTFSQPIMEQPNVLASFFRPALELLRKGVELISGNDECEAFYTGSVTPPR